MSEATMIISMTTTSRPQQRYDHRLRDLVRRTGDLTIATNLGVPRSTARGWRGAVPTVVVGLEVADLTEPELRQEILEAAATRREARGAAPAGPGPVTYLRVQPLRRTSAGRPSQASDPARRGSGPRLYSVASGPPVSGHQWLFLHSLESVATVRRLVAFYVHEYNHVRPHSAFRGHTPDEMYFRTGEAAPADLTSRAAAAGRAKGGGNRSASCKTCPSVNAAA